jgi:hypothetical protein
VSVHDRLAAERPLLASNHRGEEPGRGKMASCMRIGELLLEQRKLRASDLTRALAEKPADKRLCSFLIANGLVEFDDASRALGEQRGIACALSKHLAGRDPAMARAIPAEFGRSSCALPIGKTSKGSVIVCVRDPAPALQRALEQAIGGEVLMVIAPATRLEHLVADAYGTAPLDEFDIDFDIAVEAAPPPVHVPRRPLTTTPQPLPRVVAPHARPDTPAPRPPLPDMDALDPESIRLSLTDLDDVRVDKDPAQSGQLPTSGGTLPPTSQLTAQPPPTSSLAAALASGTARGRATIEARPTKPMSLDAMQLGLQNATTREAATDLVLAFIAQRWHVGLVLAIRDKTAIGYRGHGVASPERVAVSLGSPSTVQRAVQTRFVSIETSDGVGQSALAHALSGPVAPAAAPVLVGGRPVAVIAVGDPIEGPQARDFAAADLALLAEALGRAYARIMAR